MKKRSAFVYFSQNSTLIFLRLNEDTVYCEVLLKRLILWSLHLITCDELLCEDNIRINLWEFGWGSIDFIYLAQDRDRYRALVSAVMNLQVP